MPERGRHGPTRARAARGPGPAVLRTRTDPPRQPSAPTRTHAGAAQAAERGASLHSCPAENAATPSARGAVPWFQVPGSGFQVPSRHCLVQTFVGGDDRVVTEAALAFGTHRAAIDR